MHEGRRIQLEQPNRRWIGGGQRSDAALPDAALRLARHAGDTCCRWRSAGRAAGHGVDQVDAERLIWQLVDAGLAEVHERLDKRRDWEPYEWRLTQAGRSRFEVREEPVDVDGWLARTTESRHPVLNACRAWVENARGSASAIDLAVVMAIGEELGAGRLPSGRLLSLQIRGRTKAVRVHDHRDTIEDATGLPLEQVVRTHGRAVLVYGPISFRLDGRVHDAEWSVPWLALTPETVALMTDVDARSVREIRSIENLTAFEEEVRRAREPNVLYVYTGGFPGALELDLLTRLVAAGVPVIRHWSDLDLGGLRILRYLVDAIPGHVEPWRMEPDLLKRLPTTPLTPRDIAGLKAWCDDPTAPGQDLARALLQKGEKAEQEGWFLAASEYPR